MNRIEGAAMERRNGLARRDFLKATGLGALGTVVAGSVVGAGAGLIVPPRRRPHSLVATDGYMTVPGDRPVYIFGFVPVDPNISVADLIANYKGHTKHTAPHLDFRQNDDVR
jgi:hypothetical protein